MATRNIVPRAHEEGNIGTALKNWLKGWFKDIFVSRYITDGVISVSVAELSEGSAYAYAESEAEDTTSSAVYIQKAMLSYTAPYTGEYELHYTFEGTNTNAAKEAMFKVEQDDTTIIGEMGIAPAIAGSYKMWSGFKRVSLVASQAYTFDLDYKAIQNTAMIRRARLDIRKVANIA